MVEKRGLKKGGVGQELSPAEQEVLTFITEEFMTISQIAVRRKTSVQAVYKIVCKIKKKGALQQGFKRVEKNRGTFKPPATTGKFIRLHGQEFNIRILHKGPKYDMVRGGCNRVVFDECSVSLFRDSVEVYSGRDFWGDSAHSATVKAFRFWNRFFAKLENDLGVVLVKARSQNVMQVKAHYAEVQNEIARECGDKADLVRLYSSEDGRLWFVIDNSFNLHEAETVHGETAKRDMDEVFRPFMNDLRDNGPFMFSEIVGALLRQSELVEGLAAANKDTAVGLSAVTKVLETLLKVLSSGGVQQHSDGDDSVGHGRVGGGSDYIG